MGKIRICKECGKEFNSDLTHHILCEDCYNKKHIIKVCPVCGSKFRIKYQDNECCSKKCARTLHNNLDRPEVKEKIARTNLEKYGVENPWNNKDIQKKCIANRVTDKWKQSLSESAAERFKEVRHYKSLHSDNRSISKKELLIKEMLENMNKPFEQGKVVSDCSFKNPLRFDFYLPAEISEQKNSPELFIEYDGEQHYKPVRFNNITDSQMYENFISCQVKDWVKDLYCIENNKGLIRIKYTDKQPRTFEDIYNKNTYKIISKNHGSDDKLTILDLKDQDFVNYKEANFVIYSGVTCTFKCEKEAGIPGLCQNCALAKAPKIDYSIEKCIKRFDDQFISKVITFQGLEPLDNLKQLLWFIYKFRQNHNNLIIIWTGYTKEECKDLIYLIKEKMKWSNIIMKYGRYVPGQESHYDELLGIKLANKEQYAEKIS